MYNSIISLNQVSTGKWMAKYQGSYGIYTIKIEVNNGKMSDFSCSCPSDYSPCKHIAYILEEIEIMEPIASVEIPERTNKIKALLENIPNASLKMFIADYARFDEVFFDKFQLAFLEHAAPKPEKKQETYNNILKKALKKVSLGYDDMYGYHEESIEIDVLDEWLDKAEKTIDRDKADATAMLKAIIEEYTGWAESIDDEMLEYMDHQYLERPFDLLEKIALEDETIAADLFEYAIRNAANTSHSSWGYESYFNDLLILLTRTPIQLDRFLVLQQKFLEKTADSNLHDAETVTQRIITVYRNHGREKDATSLIETNIWIPRFRKQLVEQKIAGKDYIAAKQLINELLNDTNKEIRYNEWEWNVLLLQIARQENDIPAIRKLSFGFIENRFDADYYRIYKNTFDGQDWIIEQQQIIKHYENGNQYFKDAIADIFVIEKDPSNLIAYLEKYLSIGHLEKYYSHFVKENPEKTLQFFRKSIDHYALVNTGRSHYENIVKWLRVMSKIGDGREIVKQMVANYLVLYKNRRAMIDILKTL